MAKNTNIPSNNPLVKKHKKVGKELSEVLHAEGYGTLFSTPIVRTPAAQLRWNTKKHLVVKAALELGMTVPQKLIDELHLGDPDPNPPVPQDDSTKAPF